MPPRGLGAKKERPKNAKGTTLRILKYVMNYRYVVLALLMLTVISNLGNLLGPTFAGKAIGAAVGKGQVDFDTVAFYAGCMLAANLIGNIMSFLATQGMMRMGRRVARKMRQDVFDKLMGLPVSYFDRNQAGDIISRVSYDIDVVTTTLQDAVNIMRGEPGTPVNVQVQRGDQLLDFAVDRAVVHVNWVNSCMLDGDVGYISLYEFSGDCSPSFAVHLDNLMSQGAKALVIDLRDNPGGWVDDAQKVADMFLEEGNVASLVYRDGTTELYTTTTDGKENPIPLVVLVNEYSASASEILAGALQDRGRATIVGTQTFGKGVVQYVLPVGTRGAGMQLTVAQYYTPNGNEVHKVGITPDIEATLPEGDTTMYDIGDLDDAQLKKAYEVALDLIEP